jgi:H+/Cl- antiporter ClcA
MWVIAGLLFVMTILFNYIFEPFVVYLPEHKMDYFWISFIHACSPVAIIGLLSLFKTTSKTEENWNVQKEMLLIAFFLLLVGITQFLIRDIIYNNSNNWSWRYLYEEIRNTFLIGTLFAIFLTSLNYNRLNAKHIKSCKYCKFV